MKTVVFVFGILATATMGESGLAMAAEKIEIASIRDDAPNLATHAPLMIDVSDYSFLLDEDQATARLVVDYKITSDDPDTPILDPTRAVIPGLSYDARSSAIVFSDNGIKTVCATVKVENGIFGKYLDIESTGLCRVTSVHVDHNADDGSGGTYRTLDVYFEAP